MHVFVLRYVVTNVFATFRQSGLGNETTSMWEWQWQVLQQPYDAHLVAQCTLCKPAVGMEDSRHTDCNNLLLCFARNVVPMCVFHVLSSPKAWYNKSVQIRGFK